MILGIGHTLEGRLLLFNGAEGSSRVLQLRGKAENCPLITEEKEAQISLDPNDN